MTRKVVQVSRWQVRPDGSTWGDWGEDDEWGRLNLLTPASVLRAAQEVCTGQTFSLSLPLDLPGGSVLNPRRRPPRIEPTLSNDGAPRFNYLNRAIDPR